MLVRNEKMKHSIDFKIGSQSGKVIVECSEAEIEDVVYLYTKVYKAKGLLINYNLETSVKGKSVKQALNYAYGVSIAAGYSGVIG